MSVKKPLVITNGQIEQLQSTDSIAQADLIVQTNGNAGAVVCGAPVYSSANDTVDKAQANAVGTVNVLGLMVDASTASAGTGSVQSDGILSLTTTQWDAIAGTSGGLTKDAIYYLDAATPGKITATAPSTTGQFVKQIGIALSTTELKIEIGQRIKL